MPARVALWKRVQKHIEHQRTQKELVQDNDRDLQKKVLACPHRSNIGFYRIICEDPDRLSVTTTPEPCLGTECPVL